jgi:hypothetical protein
MLPVSRKKPLSQSQFNPLGIPGRRPGFDPSHPAAQNIRYSGVANGANFISLLNGKPGTPSISGSVLDGQIGPAATIATTTGGGNNITVAGGGSAPSVATIACIFKFNGTSAGNYQGLLGTFASGFGWWIGIENAVQNITVSSGGTSSTTAFTPVLSVGVPYFVAVSSSLTGGNLVVVNLATGAIQSQTVTYGSSLSAAGGEAPYVLGTTFTFAAANGLDGSMAAAMYSAQFMSLSQLQQWAQDPWAFWYPRTLDMSMMLKGSSGNAYTVAGAEGSFTISGQAATTAASRKLANAEGAFTISGQAAAFSRGHSIAGAEGAFTISGQAAGLGIGMPGAEGAFVISGQSATLTYTPHGNYTLSGAEGSFTISGQAGALNRAGKLAGAEGSFSISGQAMLPAVGMSGTEGAFVISGEPATLNRGIKLAGAEGAFVISGQSSVLGHGYNFAPNEGSFVISGQSSKFPVALSMKGVEGSFVISGQGAVLSYTPVGGGGVSHSNPFFATPGPMTSLP